MEVDITLDYLKELDRIVRSMASRRGDVIIDRMSLSPQEVEEEVICLLEERLL